MKPRALVCEDDSALRAAVGDLLEAHGWAATEAATATAAIDMASALHPDLVVLDVELSGMSGLESIPRVRAGSPGVRVVAMSVRGQAPDLCLSAGACAVVDTHDLRRLEEVLAGLEISQAA
ncbi:MAG: response regulator [Acidimicrobiales bacterium]